MTKTMEDIRGINLKVGDMFEITLDPISDENKLSIIGYFQKLYKNGKNEAIIYMRGKTSTGQINPSAPLGKTYFQPLEEIGEIKILEYKE